MTAQPAAPDSSALLAGLDPDQRAAAASLIGPVCILAGAGTGKTRAITHRIAYGVATGVYPPKRVMALTFTARAAGELRGRLRALGADGVAARTFHATALAQLNHFWPTLIGGTLPRIVEGKARLLGQAAEVLRLPVDTAVLRDVAAEIEWRKVSGLDLAGYTAAGRAVPAGLDAGAVLELQQAYEDLKDERRQIDFEDVLVLTAGMLEQEPRIADEVRASYRFFVVDEYQDVSPLQQQLLELWLGDRRDLCVVGDASQTIYTFAGASSDGLLGFEHRYPDAKVLRLERNYRSAPAVIDAANRLMRHRAGALELVPAAAHGTAPIDRVEHDDELAEARWVASRIRQARAAGVAARDIAVLYRVNGQAAALEKALGEAEIPFAVHGARRFFSLPEVKQALMLLRGATVGPSNDAGAAAEPLFKSVSDILRSLGWTQEPPAQPGAVRQRWEALDALMTLAEQAQAGTTLAAFVSDLEGRSAAQHEPDFDQVALATLHSAKGLEWPVVFIVGLVEGYLPIAYATTQAAIDEERRLLYVGLTRAKERLTLSWTRVGPHRSGTRLPSRFLAEIEPPAPVAAPA